MMNTSLSKKYVELRKSHDAAWQAFKESREVQDLHANLDNGTMTRVEFSCKIQDAWRQLHPLK